MKRGFDKIIKDFSKEKNYRNLPRLAAYDEKSENQLTLVV